MTVIYEPKGQAREYAPLATNIYEGCDHRCSYCYAPSVLQKTRLAFGQPKPRPNFLAHLEKDAFKLRKLNPIVIQKDLFGTIDTSASTKPLQVTLCFTCDPYQKINDQYKLTASTIQILHRYNISVCVLTKGGSRALQDINLFKPGFDVFASTLTFLHDLHSRQFEPGAALPEDRINTLKIFHDKGIFTWVSLEPTIIPAVSLQIIRETYKFVDLYKIGKWNYCERNNIDWQKYTEDAVKLCRELGKDYYVKNDLRMFLPLGYPQSTKTPE